jgi:tetratricopeptide (TPR) repeat protein
MIDSLLLRLRLRARTAGLGEAAVALWDHYVEESRRLGGPNSGYFATALNDRGIFREATGRYAESLRDYEAAVAYWQGLRPGSLDALLAAGLINLADARRQLGEFEAAMVHLVDAMGLINEPGTRYAGFGISREVERARCLVSIGRLHIESGQPEQAERVLTEAWMIGRREMTGQDPDLGSILKNLAVAETLCGHLADACRHAAEAVEIKRRAYGPSAWAERSRAELGAAYMAASNFAGALTELRAACRASTRLGETLYLDAIRIHELLGDVYVAAGREEKALKEKKLVAEKWTAVLSGALKGVSDNRRLHVARESLKSLDRLLSLLIGNPVQLAPKIDFVYSTVLRRKGIVLEVMRQERIALMSGLDPALITRWEELRALQAELTRIGLSGAERTNEVLVRVKGLESDRQRLEADLSREIPEVELERRLREISGARVREALPDDSALIEFVRFSMVDFRRACAPLSVQSGGGRYLAFISVPAGIPAKRPSVTAPSSWWTALLQRLGLASSSARSGVGILDLGDADEIDVLVDSFLARVQDRLDDARPGQLLRAAVFDKVVPFLGGRTRLLLAPDGELARLPFEVLPTAQAGARVIDEYEISYLTTGRDVIRFGGNGGHAASAPVVLANPDFNLSLEGSTGPAPQDVKPGRRFVFEPLPEAVSEGKCVAQKLGVEPWLGAAASKSRLLGCRSPRILHLATHGYFRPCTPAENPMLRSGLALAGANTWLPTDQRDKGLLTAEDVTGLDLRDTELVVLSACDTGRGTVRVGEGVVGLRRSFVLAGARTLVMSLWRVRDRKTSEIMKNFYEGLLAKPGQGCASALRSAQLSLRDKHSDPLYWGAFICQGDPGRLRIGVHGGAGGSTTGSGRP